MDLRDDFIARVVEGSSFADVGARWGTVNEKVFVAAKHNACRSATIDVSSSESDLRRLFRERIASLGIGSRECISSDVCTTAADPGYRYDVVHYSGVLYHYPNPVSLVDCLKRIMRRYLVMTSAVVRQSAANEIGSVEVPSSGAIFVPALNTQEREVLRRYWRENAGVESCYGITEPVSRNTNYRGPWWWLFTSTVTLAMATFVGLRVLVDGPTWDGDAHTALLEVVS